MIKIFPFQALMPVPAQAHLVACEPYDVISTEEARERALGNPLSFLHVVRSEIDLPAGTDPYSPQVYEKAAESLRHLVDSRVLVETAAPGMFIYRQIFEGREQYGVVCTCSAQQYRDELIKKHEKTRPDKEDDRTRHLTVCSAHAEPVFLTFRDSSQIEMLIRADVQSQPIIDFQAVDGVRHTVWQVAAAEAYQQAFEKISALYIADGHHRTAGGERAAMVREKQNPNHTGNEEYNRILAVIFPASHLKILAYNRVVRDLNGLSETSFLKKLAELGSVRETVQVQPDQPGMMCIYLRQKWYEFRFPPSSIPNKDPIGSLDVSLLQSRILAPILGIADPRTDQRLGFVGGIRGTSALEDLVNRREAAVAFSMFPTSIQQLLDVSDAGAIMPPKSTWFEPKLRSGLFVHQFEAY